MYIHIHIYIYVCIHIYTYTYRKVAYISIISQKSFQASMAATSSRHLGRLSTDVILN